MSNLDNADSDSPGLQKMRSRMLSEDYKYRMLNEDGGEEESETTPRVKRVDTYLKCVLLVSFILILGLSILLVWMYFTTADLPCLSADCVESSAYIMNKMNLSVDPCDDFYEYACGRWTDQIIPPDKPKYGSFQEADKYVVGYIKRVLDDPDYSYKGHTSTAVKKAKEYYKLCMDKSTVEKRGTEPVLKMIKKLGSWPLTNDSLSGLWKENSWDLVEALVTNHNFSSSALFSTSVGADDMNSTLNMITISQAGLTLSSYEEYLSDNITKIHKAFMEFSTQVLELLGVNNDTAKSMMQKVWEFETKLAKIFVPKEQLTDPKANYHKMTVKDIQTIMGDSIDMLSYMNKVFVKTFSNDQELLCYTPTYFGNLTLLLKDTPKDVLATYMVWNFIQDLTGYLPRNFIDAAMVIIEAESGVSVISPLWERCSNKATAAFEFALGALYVQDKFPPENKKEVENIYEHIKGAFISKLPSVVWMDDKTRAAAKVKAEALIGTIGYPDWILDPKKLDKYYSEVEITDQLFESHINILNFGQWLNFHRLGNPPDRTEWSMSPTEINAYYTSSYNKIVIPAAILQRPFFDLRTPWAFNIGAMGMVAGHELTHGFDNKGRNFDKYGNMKNWWTKESVEKFQKETTCMKNQYSNYTIQGIHVNGLFTLGENIADNGGVRTAYLAYNNWKHSRDTSKSSLPGLGLSDDQLFFLGYSHVWCSYYTPQYAKNAILTDEHGPAKYRVIGVLQNMPEFSKAFQCSKNSYMNPQNRCKVW